MNQGASPDTRGDPASPSPCTEYWKSAGIDLAVCAVGILALVSGETAGLILAIVILYAYGYWAVVRSRIASDAHSTFKGQGLLGSFWMFILLGAFSPIIHLFFYNVPRLIRCTEISLPGIQSSSERTTKKPNRYWSAIKYPLVCAWAWLVVLVLFSACYHLLRPVPDLILGLMDAVTNGGPDMGRDLIGWLLYNLIALPIVLILFVLGVVTSYIWGLVSIALAACFAGYVSWKAIPSIAGGSWPKTDRLILGSLATFVLSSALYILIIDPLLLINFAAYDSVLELFVSAPFLIMSTLVAILSIPIMMIYVRVKSDTGLGNPGTHMEENYGTRSEIGPSNDEPIFMADVQNQSNKGLEVSGGSSALVEFIRATSAGEAMQVFDNHSELNDAKFDTALRTWADRAEDDATRAFLLERLDLLRRCRFIAQLTEGLPAPKGEYGNSNTPS